MDPKKFREQLEKFGKIKAVKVPRTAARREAEDEDSIWRNGEQFLIDPKNNHTLGVMLEKVYPIVKACEDCNQVVENRMIEHKKYDFPFPHWRSNCVTCGLSQNPVTKEYEIERRNASHGFKQALLDSDLAVKYKKPAK